ERPSEISKENVIKYLLYVRNKKNWSASEQNGTINAIKFFYEKVLNRPKEVYDIPRAKKPFQLPEVYSEEEIMKIINAAKNLKHRCIICAANAGGMGVSELNALKIKNLDSGW
ncbi:MAG: site-specific integrase, partial [Ignavibacteria bacterium]|nr:site-specific integrase [Ignavibacteria bacterium]